LASCGDTIRAAADLTLPMVAIPCSTQRVSRNPLRDGVQSKSLSTWRVEDFLKNQKKKTASLFARKPSA